MPRTDKWSLKFDCCVKCGRNDVKHIARGLCLNCYQQETEKRGRGKQRIAKGLASRKLNYKYLYKEYVNKKRSLGDIAKDCDCGRQYVYKIMKEFNIPLRTLSEARKLVYDRHKISYKLTDASGNERLVIQGGLKINKDFFKSWSNEMAYVFGVIYTDGHLSCDEHRKIYQFIVSQKEPELLNKLLKLMDCNAQLHHRKKHGISGDIYLLNVHHPQIYSDLISLGLSPSKSKTIDFPNIPQELVRHFIRGCWDGDGSVYISGGKINANYACGSLKFIERLVQELYKVGIYKRRPPLEKIDADKMWLNYPDGRFPLKIHQEKRSKSYYIKLDSRENLEKLFDYFYDRIDESMYLDRKFKIFAKGLGVITDGFQETREGCEGK